MQLGVTQFVTDRSMDVVDLARAVEERGFSSLFVPEHTHIPTSRRTPPPTGDVELRDEYKRALDPFVALTAAAAVTERLRVGTGICLVAQRDPIVTAKAIASLDLVSRGRFVFGIGFGWNEDELEHHGVAMAQRREVVRERVLAMRALWTEEVAAFEGEHVRFSPSWSWPKPVQQPSPPVLIGGDGGPKLFAAIADYADGWIPIGGRGVKAALPELRAAFEAVGRDPDSVKILPFGTIPEPAKLEYYESLGITEVVVRLPSAPADDVLRVLDSYEGLIAPDGKVQR